MGKSLIQAILWMPLDTNHLLKLVCRLNKPPWRRPALMASIPQAGILCAELHINCSGAAGGARRNPWSADVTSEFPRSESEKQRSIEALLPARKQPGRTIGHREQLKPFFPARYTLPALFSLNISLMIQHVGGDIHSEVQSPLMSRCSDVSDCWFRGFSTLWKVREQQKQ